MYIIYVTRSRDIFACELSFFHSPLCTAPQRIPPRKCSLDPWTFSRFTLASVLPFFPPFFDSHRSAANRNTSPRAVYVSATQGETPAAKSSEHRRREDINANSRMQLRGKSIGKNTQTGRKKCRCLLGGETVLRKSTPRRICPRNFDITL